MLDEVVAALATTRKAELPALVAGWLDTLDATGRWALLKLVTGGLRVGASARLAKLALAEYGRQEPAEIEEVWHGLAPPYAALFAWLDGSGPRPAADEAAGVPAADAGASGRGRGRGQGRGRARPATWPSGSGTASGCRSRPPAVACGSTRAAATTSRTPSPTWSRRWPFRASSTASCWSSGRARSPRSTSCSSA